MKRHSLLIFFLLATIRSIIASVNVDGVYYELHYAERTATVVGTPSGQMYSGEIIILSSITVGNYTFTVDSIDDGAFHMSQITKITIPESVNHIGSLALASNTLKEIIWNAQNCTISGYIFNSPSSPSNVEKLTFGNNVKSIPDYLCSRSTTGGNNLPKLKKIIIPNKVESIGDYAFFGCSSITDVTIGTGVQSIGNNAFHNLKSLKHVYWNAISCLPAGSGSVFDSSTWGYENEIDSIVFGNLVEDIPSHLCPVYTKITNVTIPENVKSVGVNAFSNANMLTTLYWNAKNCADLAGAIFSVSCQNVIFGNKVRRIPAYLCSNLSNLTSVAIPSSVSKIGKAAFYGTGLLSITIPNNVSKIEEQTFQNCVNLSNVTWSNNIDTIGKAAFYQTGLVGSITLPNSIKVIEENAFENTDSIREVFLPININTIKGDAFDCDSLYIIHMKGTTPPTLVNHPFKLILNQNVVNGTLDVTYIRIIVPQGTLNTYKNVSSWNYYRNYIEEETNSGGIVYTVTFKDWDGSILKTEQVRAGSSATPPANPTRSGYTFIGWDKDYSNVTSNMTITALYQKNSTYYTVTFKDWDGSILKTEQVRAGSSATPPANPTRSGYTFIGWDKDYSNVTSNMTITALYQKNGSGRPITVSLKRDYDWYAVFLWAWYSQGDVFNEWPGLELSQNKNGWYSYTFDKTINPVNIVWSNGWDQTVDITNITESTCYALNSTSGRKITVSVVDCPLTEDMEETVATNNNTQKVIQNGHLYILLPDGTRFDATGKKVE